MFEIKCSLSLFCNLGVCFYKKKTAAIVFATERHVDGNFGYFNVQLAFIIATETWIVRCGINVLLTSLLDTHFEDWHAAKPWMSYVGHESDWVTVQSCFGVCQKHEKIILLTMVLGIFLLVILLSRHLHRQVSLVTWIYLFQSQRIKTYLICWTQETL